MITKARVYSNRTRMTGDGQTTGRGQGVCGRGRASVSLMWCVKWVVGCAGVNVMLMVHE